MIKQTTLYKHTHNVLAIVK